MNFRTDWRRLLDAGWWHWVITIPLLAAHVSLGGERSRPAFEVALLLCVAMAGFALWRTGNPAAMAVQVRVAFAALLVLGLAPAAQWFHWLQLAGMTSMVTVGYCPLERLLSLMPWNRRQALTAKLVLGTFLAPPARGGIFRPDDGDGTRAMPGGPSCVDAGPCGLIFTPQRTGLDEAGRTAQISNRTVAGRSEWRFGHEMEVTDIIRTGM